MGEEVKISQKSIHDKPRMVLNKSKKISKSKNHQINLNLTWI